MTNSNNTKGFTLIELIMVTIILGILAAVAIPRYMTSITKAEEAAEDAVISSIRAGLETYATEQMMATGLRFWPDNPWTALSTTPAGYAATGNGSDQDADGIADSDGEWTFNAGNINNIIHQRGYNALHHWNNDKRTKTGANAARGSRGAREVGVRN